jgi:hypothetical protein
MTSWKKYGGLNKNDKMNNITATSIVTDTFTVRQGFLNTFVVDGDLKVYGTIYTDNLDVSAGGTISTDYITVRKNAIISDKLNFNTINDVYMKGSSGKIGINTATPSSTLDIVSFDNIQQSILNVYANNIQNRNILARNNVNNGIALYANNTTSTLQFYSNSNITSTTAVNASITHSPGVLQLNASGGYTRIYNRLVVSNPPRDVSSQVLNESAVIYDVSSGTYFNNIYSKPLVKTGNALTLVSNDNSSNTFLNIVGPSGNGFKIGGGAFPMDISRNMGVLTLDGTTTPSQIFVSGNSSVKNHSTVGFNTYSPKIDSFAVDINGPVHVNNGEITLAISVSFQINRVRGSKENPLYGIAVGSSSSTTVPDFKIAYTTNGGVSWNLSSPSITTVSNISQFRSCYVYDASNSIIVADNATAFYSNTSGSSWNQISISAPAADTSFNDVYISKTGTYNGFVVYENGYTYFTMNFTTGPSNATIVSQAGFNIKGVDGSGSTVFLVGGNTIKKINNTSPGTIVSTYTTSSLNADYNSINVYNNYAVAVGANIISYTTNNGSTWTDISISNTLTNVLAYNEKTAIAVGASGAVYITRNGLNWDKVDNNMFNSSGASSLIINTQNLTGVYLSDPNTVIISKIITNYSSGSILGSSDLFNLYTPYFANNTNNNVFDICGNMRISGDLYVNDLGRIESNNTEFELLNRNIYNSLSVGGNAKAVSIGANNGVVQIVNQFKTNGDASFNSNLYLFGNTITSGNVLINSKIQSGSVNTGSLLVDGGAGITGNVFIGGNINIKGTLDAGSINISGATIGDDVSFNKTVYVKGAAGFGDDIYQLDGKYNINIAAASLGTFPNYGGTAIGPNLINIGSGNYNVVAGGLKDSIAIGNTITTAYAANSGYGIIGIGENIFTSLTTGFQNTGIGNTIATSMTTGYNNVFIGNGVARSTTSTGNTVAIGTAAGKTNTTGINNTYLGAFTDANSTAYNNSTALGYGAQITKSNQIKLGTAAETVDVSGFMNITGNVKCTGVISDNKDLTTREYVDYEILTKGGTILLGSANTWTNNNTFKSNIYQIDSSYNINIAAASLGTFPNYGGTAIGPNLINIGSGNYNVVAGGLKDSIAIGNTITTAYAANSGYGIIGIGENIFTSLTTGFQNTGIGNTIATSMTTGYNNVFIGNGVATSTTSTGNTVAIGTAAGITNTTGINNTYLGAFTDANSTAYNNSTALGYGAQITNSNQIKLGTAAETVDVSGFMNITGNVKCTGVISDNKDLTTREYVDYEILTKGGTILLGSANTWTNNNTFKSNIYQIDSSYNINIAAASLGTFPNYGTTAIGPNLINIGSGNYNVVAGGLKDSIAIGNTITTAYAADSGYGIIGIGENIFTSLTTGFQNTGIGNTIATSMIGGYNNVFIGNGVATSTIATIDTVAIGTAAGKTNINGINNTYLGAFTDANSTVYNNSTALGYGSTITTSNQIKLGTTSERVDVSGNLNVYGAINSVITDPTKRTTVPFAIGSSGTYPNTTAISSPLVINGISSGTGDGANTSTFNLGIFSFNGIGFVDTQGNACKASIAVRTGIYTGVSFNATSDYRIKKNVIGLTDKYIVDKLKPVKYFNELSKRHDIGFIAHEVQEQFAELVSGEKDGDDNQSINYNGLIAISVHEIKQLKQKIAELEQKIAELEQIVKNSK